MNQRGFITVLMLSLAPLLIAGFGASAALWWGLHEFQSAQKICLETSWNAQNQMIALFQELIGLNPEAFKWIKEKIKAKEWLKRAVFTKRPEVIAAATARLTYVIYQQSLIRQKQQAVFAQAGLLQRQWLQTLNQELNRGFREGHSQTDVPFAVKTEIYDETAPTYAIESPLLRKQESSYRFTVLWNVRFPEFMKELWQESQLLTGVCRVSLKIENSLWKEKWSVALINAR